MGNSQPVRPARDRHPLEGIRLRELIPLAELSPEFEAWLLAANPKTHEVVYTNRQDDRELGDLTTDDLICLYGYFESRQDWERCQKIAALLAMPTDTPPMGLSVLTNFPATLKKEKITRQRCGFGGITSKGKKMLRSACAVLSENIPRQTISFLTLTLPSLSPDEIILVAENWATIVDTFLKWLRRKLENHPPVVKWLYCTEIQSHRQDDLGGLPVPHLHLVFQGRATRYSPWFVSKTEYKNEWQKLLESLLGRPVNCDAATRIESVRGDIKKEVSKYVSKGSKTVKAAIDKGYGTLLPKQWWGMTRNLSQTVRLNIRRISDRRVANLVTNLYRYQMADLLKYKAIEVESKIVSNKGDPMNLEFHANNDTKPMIVGFAGFALVDDLEDLLVYDKSEIPSAIRKAKANTKRNNVLYQAGKLRRFDITPMAV